MSVTREPNGRPENLLRASHRRTVRLYHLLPANYALEDLRNKRLKVSQIDQLNDPFELWCVAQKDVHLRVALRRYREAMVERFGLICFSKRWHNPVLWSHYGDKHRGICLGFDVDDRGVKPVAYLNDRPRLVLPPTFEDSRQLLFSKFVDWQYEEEWRCWITLEERDAVSGFFFFPFGDFIQLREVIAGPLCPVPASEIRELISGFETPITLVKARLAFRSFAVVKNKRGFR